MLDPEVQMMNCQCQGVEQVFDTRRVTQELRRYRAKGPSKTTRILVKALEDAGVEGLTLLDIGGGVGAVQHELLSAGASTAMDVEVSSAYLSAARDEANRRGLADKVSFKQGNFVDLAVDIPPADIVTLDRVICCYNDMETLVSLSAQRAGKLYGLVYPRDSWGVRIVLAIQNFFLRLRKSTFRTFVYPTRAVEAQVIQQGLKRKFLHKGFAWQVVVFSR
jgi:magnesium-protoporphyrin O-methyltransferase